VARGRSALAALGIRRRRESALLVIGEFERSLMAIHVARRGVPQRAREPLPGTRAGWVPVASVGSLSVLLRITKYMEPQHAEGIYPADDPGPT